MNNDPVKNCPDCGEEHVDAPWYPKHSCFTCPGKSSRYCRRATIIMRMLIMRFGDRVLMACVHVRIIIRCSQNIATDSTSPEKHKRK